VILSVNCSDDKTKTAEINITKLGTGIVHPRPPMNIFQRSRLGLELGLGDRVAGLSYAPLTEAHVSEHLFQGAPLVTQSDHVGLYVISLTECCLE